MAPGKTRVWNTPFDLPLVFLTRSNAGHGTIAWHVYIWRTWRIKAKSLEPMKRWRWPCWMWKQDWVSTIYLDIKLGRIWLEIGYRPKLLRRLIRLEKARDIPMQERHISNASLTKCEDVYIVGERLDKPSIPLRQTPSKLTEFFLPQESPPTLNVRINYVV